MSSFDAIVVGGGFAGMAAAAALSSRGARVTVFEAAQSTDPRFRGELIHPRGVRGLDELGLKVPLLARGGVSVSGFAVTPSGGEDPQILHYAKEAGPGLGIDHQAMVLAMRDTVSSHRKVTVRTGERITGLVRREARVVGVQDSQGTDHRADVVVVADGRTSKLRALLGGEPPVELLSYTLAFSVEGALPAGQRGHVFLGAPGPILAYPYLEGRIRFCVDIPLGAPKGRAALVQMIQQEYAPAVPSQLRGAMFDALNRRPFEACANHSIKTSTCVAPGVVMVGDAAGCSHPLTASGMTTAIHDVLTLSRQVSRRGPDDEALAAYQRERYEFDRMRQLFTDALYEVFRGRDLGSLTLQKGIFQYWASGERARTTSMELLSGEEVRISKFIAEYARVFGYSAKEVVFQFFREPKEGASRFQSLAQTTLTRLKQALLLPVAGRRSG